ncbi:MAG: FKBP-type peptidyl-prolyl cis-trans isomerase [Chloroflexi bacterium]|nr:FKBP-type peptidyl-prolyl cis-trans isomerase [Chloroflexota bacterium]
MPATNGPPPVEAEPTTTDSGLQIIEIEFGDGETAASGSSVTVHYTGWLADGTVFDSSVARGQPATFPLNGVIQGWQEGIPGMQVGGKRRLIIPPDLGYGEGGAGGIPPNSVLIFDVELLATE